MRTDDFWVDDEYDVYDAGVRHLNLDLVKSVRSGPLSDRDDIEVAVPLAQLLHDDLEKYGTDGKQELTEPEVREAIRALLAVVGRLGTQGFDPPFRDFRGFRSFWLREGASGSWQARRDLLLQLFGPLHEQLAMIEQRALGSALVQPISPSGRTGWATVDVEITELRRHFLNARSPQDYRNVGLDCVAVTEALSRQVFDPSRHTRAGETEPPVANTKQRLERFIEDAAVGSDNAALRKLARAAIEYAQHVKHSTTPNRREAGIAADAVIQLANLMRRLDSEA